MQIYLKYAASLSKSAEIYLSLKIVQFATTIGRSTVRYKKHQKKDKPLTLLNEKASESQFYGSEKMKAARARRNGIYKKVDIAEE